MVDDGALHELEMELSLIRATFRAIRVDLEELTTRQDGFAGEPPDLLLPWRERDLLQGQAGDGEQVATGCLELLAKIRKGEAA